jgi:hypothetical protein
MNLTPINGPRTAPVLGAKTISSDVARTAAMAKFNEGLTVASSPSQEGAILDPSSKRPQQEVITQSPSKEVSATPEAMSEAQPLPSPAPEDLEARRIASHYANLARKEKALRFREAQIRRAAQEMRPAREQPSFDSSQYVNKNDLIQNPFGVLNNLGMTYEQLTQKALDAPSAEDLQQRREIELLKNELKTLRDGQEQVKKTYDENQTMARRQAELQIRQDVNRLVSNDKTFQVIQAQRAAGEVVRLITSVYDKGMGPDYPRGTILDIGDAAAMVESELTERALRVARLDKIQSQINSNKSASMKQQNNQQQQTNNGSSLRTLTNGVGTGTRKLTSRERAMAAFRGEEVS